MRRADFDSEADYYRAHRAAFTLALELGCTPKEAEAVMRRRGSLEARQAWKEGRSDRLGASMEMPPCSLELPGAPEPEERREPYWID